MGPDRSHNLPAKILALMLHSSMGEQMVINDVSLIEKHVNNKNLGKHISGNSLSYYKKHRALHYKNEVGQQCFSDEFRQLRAYLTILKCENPDAVINFDIVKDYEGKERFGRVAIVLPQQVRMLIGAKDIASFDGGALKHLMWGSYQVLVCGGQDGGDKDLFYGIALVPSESAESYGFLMETMKEFPLMKAFLEREGMVFISDRSKGLIAAVKKHFPRAFHRYCALHLLSNIKSGRNFSEEDKSLYWNIVYAQTKDKFDEHMAKLKKNHSEAWAALNKIDPKCWANWAFGSETSRAMHWNNVSNNLSERAVRLVGCDRDKDRSLSVVSLLCRFYEKLHDRVITLREFYNSNKQFIDEKKFVPRAQFIYDNYAKDIAEYNIEDIQSDSTKFRVYNSKTPNQVRIVYMNYERGECNCTCGRKELLEGMPCHHFLKVMYHLKLQNEIMHDDAKLEMLFHKCYFVKNLRAAYEQDINLPCGNLEQDNAMGPIITANNPVAKRYLSSHEKHLCKETSKKGGKVPKKRKVGHCGICHNDTHDRRKCISTQLTKKDISITTRDLQNPMDDARLSIYHRVSLDNKIMRNPDVEKRHFRLSDLDSDFFAMEESDDFSEEISDTDDVLLPTTTGSSSQLPLPPSEEGNSRPEKRRHADEEESDEDESSSDSESDIADEDEEQNSEVWWTNTTQSLWKFIEENIWSNPQPKN